MGLDNNIVGGGASNDTCDDVLLPGTSCSVDISFGLLFGGAAQGVVGVDYTRDGLSGAVISHVTY